jgi:hypothetical protein
MAGAVRDSCAPKKAADNGLLHNEIYNYGMKSSSKDYRLKKPRLLACLAFLWSSNALDSQYAGR